jgi:hsp70-interacting protein
MDPELNKLLKWSITNSDASKDAEEEGNAVDSSKSNITPELISRLFGNQESDATLMCRYIAAVQHPEIELKDKLVAFDNFEQLIEGIDNAMNIESLGLWPDIISLLKHEEAEIRLYAAWAVGTAVQNNPKTQDQVCFLLSSSRLVHNPTSSLNTNNTY